MLLKSKFTKSLTRNVARAKLWHEYNSSPPTMQEIRNEDKPFPWRQSIAPLCKQVPLSNVEYQDWKIRDLCCSGNNKFTSGHKCCNELFIMIVREDDQDIVIKESLMAQEQIDLSINLVMKLIISNTIKLISDLCSRTITILIDNDVIHNFLS